MLVGVSALKLTRNTNKGAKMEKRKVIVTNLILIISVFFLFTEINAQNTFKKLYTSTTSILGPGIFLNIDTSYYFFNIVDCSLSKIDTGNGSIMSSLKFNNLSGGNAHMNFSMRKILH